MAFRTPWLVVSTIHRAMVCDLTGDQGRGSCRQVGLQERKQHGEFGIAILPAETPAAKPNLITIRSGFRLWMTDVDGYVKHTFSIKNANKVRSVEIPLLNPGRLRTEALPTDFGRCYPYKRDYLVTYNRTTVFIIHLATVEVVAVIRRLRAILSLAICGSEIFIVEGDRSVIRISDEAEAEVSTAGSAGKFVPPIEFEAEDVVVASADEARELPPLENIDHLLAECRLENELRMEERAMLDYSRRMEVFERINGRYDYDDRILYKKTTKKSPPHKSTVATAASAHAKGIVEIGQEAKTDSTGATNTTTSSTTTTISPETAKRQAFLVLTHGSELDASFCERFVFIINLLL